MSWEITLHVNNYRTVSISGTRETCFFKVENYKYFYKVKTFK